MLWKICLVQQYKAIHNDSSNLLNNRQSLWRWGFRWIFVTNDNMHQHLYVEIRRIMSKDRQKPAILTWETTKTRDAIHHHHKIIRTRVFLQFNNNIIMCNRSYCFQVFKKTAWFSNSELYRAYKLQRGSGVVPHNY